MEQTGESQSKRPGRHFSPTRNACFRCHNGQPCHFGATAVGLADPEAQRSALPTRRHSGHARHPQRGRPARKRTLPSPTSLPARRAPSGGVANAWKAAKGRQSSQLAIRPEGRGGHPGRHLGPTPTVTGPPGRHGQPPAVTGCRRPSWAATWGRPPRRSPPLRPRPYPWSSLAGTGAADISTFSTRLMSSCWEWTSSLR